MTSALTTAEQRSLHQINGDLRRTQMVDDLGAAGASARGATGADPRLSIGVVK
jgi:hypothetical protein